MVPKRQSEPWGQSEESVRDGGPRGGPLEEGEKGAAQKGARARERESVGGEWETMKGMSVPPWLPINCP